MKISQSARPRNRSSRNSRAPTAGSEGPVIAGAASCAVASAAPARGGPATRLEIDVIEPVLRGVAYARGTTKEHRPAVCKQVYGLVAAPSIGRDYIKTIGTNRR